MTGNENKKYYSVCGNNFDNELHIMQESNLLNGGHGFNLYYY